MEHEALKGQLDLDVDGVRRHLQNGVIAELDKDHETRQPPSLIFPPPLNSENTHSEEEQGPQGFPLLPVSLEYHDRHRDKF